MRGRIMPDNKEIEEEYMGGKIQRIIERERTQGYKTIKTSFLPCPICRIPHDRRLACPARAVDPNAELD
jgi:hypothetical protein